MRTLYVLLILSFITLPPAFAADREFGSIGAQVVPTASGEVVVLQLVEAAPAAKAGLLPGDLIVKIDGKTLKGLDFNTVTREYLWGYVGETVHFNWLRPGETGEREADLVRIKVDAATLRHPDVQMVKPKK
jgi:carboxyl-terminal processing protease